MRSSSSICEGAVVILVRDVRRPAALAEVEVDPCSVGDWSTEAGACLLLAASAAVASAIALPGWRTFGKRYFFCGPL